MTDDGFFSSDWEPTRKWPYWRLTDRQKRPSLDRRQLSIVKDRLIGAEQKIYLFRSIHKQHDGSTQRHIMITELRQEHSSTSQNLLLLLESFCSVSQLCHSNQSLTAPRAPLDTSVDSCKICADYISFKDNNGHHTTHCEFKNFYYQFHVSHFISLSLTPIDCRSLMLEMTQFQNVL